MLYILARFLNLNAVLKQAMMLIPKNSAIAVKFLAYQFTFKAALLTF